MTTGLLLEPQYQARAAQLGGEWRVIIVDVANVDRQGMPRFICHGIDSGADGFKSREAALNDYHARKSGGPRSQGMTPALARLVKG